MSDVLPLHYAMSEAAIVAAGAYAVVKAWPINRWFAVGLATMALAGLIGSIRIVLGVSGVIVTLHEFFSRFGALFGLGCIFATLLSREQVMRRQVHPPILGLAAASLVFFVPAFSAPLFGAFIIGGALLVFRAAPNRRFLAASSFAFLICSALFSAPLRITYPGFGWHVFHVLVAVWFVLVATFVPMKRVTASS